MHYATFLAGITMHNAALAAAGASTILLWQIQPQPLQLSPQRRLVNSEFRRRGRPVPIVPFERIVEKPCFDLSQCETLDGRPAFFHARREVIGEMFHLNHIAPAQYEPVLDYVFKFPHVTREIVIHEYLDDPGRDTRYVPSLQRVQPPDEMINKQGNILLALHEGRKRDPDHIDAVVQIPAE